MKATNRLLAVLPILALAATLAIAQTPSQTEHQHQDKPADKSKSSPQNHDGHHGDVNQRGDQAMGFSHEKTTHHFQLKADGGAIEVEANSAEDTASRDQIRAHLKHIAKKFAAGDFTAPMFIHAQTPPGVPAMQRLKSEIKYQFQESERGGRVRITTGNAEALKGIHEFLRFQIEDHQTGDPKEVR